MAEKKGKKKWYEVLARRPFTDQIIGETPAYEDKALIGRIISSNLGNLTRDPKLQNIKINFRINEIKEDKAYADVKGYELSGSYLKRIIKVGKNRIDDSFLVNTKDNVKVKIKPLILTKYKTQKKILGSIRNLIRKEFSEYVGRDDYDKLVSDLIGKKIQREIREKINKIYPVGIVEIRIMDRINSS